MRPGSALTRLVLPSRSNLFASTIALGSALLLGTDILHKQVNSYAAALSSDAPRYHLGAIFLGVLLGGLGARCGHGRGSLVNAVACWSLSLGVGATALFFGFGAGLLVFVLPLHSAVQAGLLTFIALTGSASLLSQALQLGLLPTLIRPSRLLLVGAAFSALLLGYARAGLVAAPFLLSLHSTACFALLGSTLAYLESTHPQRRNVGVVGFLGTAALSGLLIMSNQIDQQERLSYPGHVLYATGDHNSQRVVFCADRAGLDVFVDRRVHIAALDKSRYFAALSRSGRSAEHVLVLSAGSGAATSLVLRSEMVKQVLVVSPSDNLARLQSKVPKLQEIGENWISDPRVGLEIAEPLFWLSHSTSEFDLIVADFPAPIDQESSKYLTRHAFELLIARLSSRGVAIVSGVGRPRFPAAFEELRALAGEHKMVAVGVPSLGEWTFIELSRGPQLGQSCSSLHSPTVAQAFQNEQHQVSSLGR